MTGKDTAKIKIGTLNQVGLIVKDIQKTVKDYWNILGIGPHVIVTVEPVEGYEMNYKGRKTRYKFKASFCQVGSVELEFLQSLEGPNMYEDYLRNHGEGAHHLQSLAKSVDEVAKNIEIMEGKGFPLLMGGRYRDEVSFAYIDTVKDLKTIWELVKMPDNPTGIPDIYPAGDQEASPSKINVKAINRIGIVVKDLNEVTESYENILGIGPWDLMEISYPELHDVIYRGRKVNPLWKIGYAQAGPLKLELIQPLNGENIYSDFLKTHGEGVHHIQFLSDDLNETNNVMEEEGFPVLTEGSIGNGGFAFYDTSEPLKIIWEAVQEPKAV